MKATRRTTPVALAGLLLALTLAACGQKVGVETTTPGFVAADGSVGGAVVDPATGELVVPVEGGEVLDGIADGTLSGGSGSLPGGGGAAGGGGPGGGGGAGPSDPDSTDGTSPETDAPSGPGDTTGVTASTIKIGVHAPVTGAAAIPQGSFERAVGVYFDGVNRSGGLFGRKVEVLFEDDQFRPDIARLKCKELAEQEEVFLLIGGAGADQIDACARYAAEAGVPYISGGVHETRPGQTPMGNLSTYFAASLTYEQQAPLLARLYASQQRGNKVVVITADNDSLNGYHAKVTAEVSKVAGSNLAYADRIPKNTQSEALTIGTKICNSGAKAVVWNASPSTLLNVSKAMTCQPRFMGPGLTNGLNIVASVGCPNLNGALFYSPFPGLDVMRRNGTFVRDYQASNGQAPDDIGAAIYGIESVVGSMLKATGEDLTRERFMATIGQTKKFSNGIFPTTNFSSRFGGTAMHLLQADCGSREYKTVRTNEKP